jgi:hypothetical protein
MKPKGGNDTFYKGPTFSSFFFFSPQRQSTQVLNSNHPIGKKMTHLGFGLAIKYDQKWTGLISKMDRFVIKLVHFQS